LLENVIAGPHPADVVSLRPAVQIPDELAGIEGWKIALCMRLGDYPLEPEVVENTWAAVDALGAAGASVEEVELPWKRADIMRASWAHFGAIFAAAAAYGAGEHRDLLMPYTRAFIDGAQEASQDIGYLEGLQLEGELYVPLGQILERFDVLICPTSGIPALRAGDDYVTTALTVEGETLGDYLEAILTVPFNIASRCPVLAVPSGRTASGLPTGLQIVGRTYDDERVFRVGAVLEQVRPWFSDPSWRPPL
jgi:aspartyl-tRNA(Asn)/glutamyl-tRNA(Gln) amidotransferase subunit A